MTRLESSTLDIPQAAAVPRHIAMIMDGNGRWAKQRFMPRVAGHKRGLETVRSMVKACRQRGVEFLTLFAFSSENWRRPPDEVRFLMELFVRALEQEIERLHRNQVRFRAIGDLSRFDPKLVQLIEQAETLTAQNESLTLTVAVNYGGRWDMMQAVQRMLAARPELVSGFGEEDLAPYFALSYAPEPDLFIRTGGEQRISNFLLWHLAYSELYFTETLWPDFDAEALDRAIASYRQRERRFGRTSEQVAQQNAPLARTLAG